MGCSCSANTKKVAQSRQITKRRFTINGQRTTSTQLSDGTKKIVRRIMGH